MNIYTKTGDDGRTGLLGPGRVWKDHPRIAAYGSIDELNSLLGLIRCEPLPDPVAELLGPLQHDLFTLGAELASVAEQTALPRIATRDVDRLEQAIDRLDGDLPRLDVFILPGGTRGAALLHVARTVCRRAERQVAAVWHAAEETSLRLPLMYLNRLSDLLFVMARSVNAQANVADVAWQQPGGD